MTSDSVDPSTSRRRVLAAVGCAVGMEASFAGSSTAARPAGRQATGTWAQFQYDDANTGHAPTNTGPTAPVGPRLAVDVGRGAGTAPAVAGDLAYVANDDDTLYAIDRNDGTVRWTASAKFSAAWPSVYGNTVYLPGDSVTALDAATGDERWSTTVEGTAHGVVQIGSTIIAAGRGGVSAIDAESANVRWNNDSVSTWREPPAVVGDDVFAVDTSAGQLIALHAGGGGRQWIRHFDGPAPGGPTVEDDIVIVPGDGAVYAYDRSTGIEQWTVDETLEATVAAGNGHAYGVTGDELVALNLDGSVEWRTDVPTTTNPPVVAGGRIYLASDDGDIVAVNEADGSIHWQSSVAPAFTATFAVAGGELYAATRDGSLQVLAEGVSTATQTAASTDDGTGTDTASSAGTDTASTPTPGDEGGSADSGLLAMLGSAGLLAALLARGRAAFGGDEGD